MDAVAKEKLDHFLKRARQLKSITRRDEVIAELHKL
jgi:hypothetical protein